MAPKKHTVEFEATKTVKKPEDVAFKTKTGKKVEFEAKKPTKVKVDVKFKAKNK